MDIRNIFATDLEVSIYHKLNEANSCAYFLAKMGAEQMIEFFIWNSPSP